MDLLSRKLYEKQTFWINRAADRLKLVHVRMAVRLCRPVGEEGLVASLKALLCFEALDE